MRLHALLLLLCACAMCVHARPGDTASHDTASHDTASHDTSQSKDTARTQDAASDEEDGSMSFFSLLQEVLGGESDPAEAYDSPPPHDHRPPPQRYDSPPPRYGHPAEERHDVRPPPHRYNDERPSSSQNAPSRPDGQRYQQNNQRPSNYAAHETSDERLKFGEGVFEPAVFNVDLHDERDVHVAKGTVAKQNASSAIPAKTGFGAQMQVSDEYVDDYLELPSSTEQATSPTSRVTEPTSRITEATSRITEAPSRITEQTPRITEFKITEITSKTPDQASRITEQTYTVPDITSRITEQTSRNPESTSRFPESTSRVTEVTSRVTEQTSRMPVETSVTPADISTTPQKYVSTTSEIPTIAKAETIVSTTLPQADEDVNLNYNADDFYPDETLPVAEDSLSRNNPGQIAADIPEPAPLSSYHRPGLYGVNNGQPFYLDKDPVTGDVNYNAKTPIQKTPALITDDYFYDETVDVDGIDRKDGKILNANTYDKYNPFNNLPLNYNDFNKVQDFNNHKTIDYPLISSSYANMKVQGTAGEKQTNHKPYAVTVPTQSPSYYTTRSRPAATTAATTRRPATTEKTTTAKYYDYEEYEAETTLKSVPIPNYGDKLKKKPSEYYNRPSTVIVTKRPTAVAPPETYLPNENVYKPTENVYKPVSRYPVIIPQETTTPRIVLPIRGVLPENSYEVKPSPEDYEEYDSGAESSDHHSVSHKLTPETTTSTTTTTTSTTTTQKPTKLVGNIVYAETPVRTTTNAPRVETTSPHPVTSMPLGNSFQFNRGPNLNTQPPRDASRPADQDFVNNVQSNTGGSFLTKRPTESPYGIYAEEPFRPIYGPGDKLVGGKPEGNRGGIPQETPDRWSYPNAPLSPEFFSGKKEGVEGQPPRIVGVEPPRQTPAHFLQEPAVGNVSPWGNSQQLFQVSSHVKFPSSGNVIQVSDNVAEEGHLAPTQFKRPPPSPSHQLPVQNSLIRGSVLPARPNPFPQQPAPVREPVSSQRPVGNGYLVREPSVSFNVPLRTDLQAGGHNNVQVQGDTFDVPIGVSLPNGESNFPTNEASALVSPTKVVTGQRPTFPQPSVTVETNAPTNVVTPRPNADFNVVGELPTQPMVEVPEGSIPLADVPAQELLPPRPVPWTPPRPNNNNNNNNNNYRKQFNQNRRQGNGGENLPNILPQFRPNAKSPHAENTRLGHFGPQRQPLMDRPGRPVMEHMQPPPSRLRNRNDNLDDLSPAYDKFPQQPPSVLHRPLVHRRAGPHVDSRPHVTTLQMIQQFPRQTQHNNNNHNNNNNNHNHNNNNHNINNKINKDPVFVVYPVKNSQNGNSPGPDREVVVGIRGPHLPVPPSNLNPDDDLLSRPYQHNKNQKPLLQPSKDRDVPILRLPTSRPLSKNEFPYALVEPEENREHAENEEGNTEVSKSSIDETIEAEVYNNHPSHHEDSEVNVIPYLQDYMPFATKTPVQYKPKAEKPITVAESLWSLLGGGTDETRIVTKPKDEQISVTLRTVPSTNGVAYAPTTSAPSRPTDYPRPAGGAQDASVHQAVVGSEGSEFTLSAVMHTVPQAGRPVAGPAQHHRHRVPANHRPPANHDNGNDVAPANQNFQAPFQASTNVGDAPVSQGWNIVDREDGKKRGGATDMSDGDADVGVDAGEKSTFDFENFKPELIGGFKPIYSTTQATDERPQHLLTEREEKNMSYV